MTALSEEPALTNVTPLKSPKAIGPGDVVTLKSGGPQMTVRLINGDMVFCSWFDVEQTACSAMFHVCELVKK